MQRNLQATKLLLIGALTFWSGLFCMGQKRIDSLTIALKQAEQSAQRAELNLLLAKEWIIKNQDSAWLYAEEALKLSRSSAQPKQEIEALNMQANILQRRSENEEAMALYSTAISKAEALDYKEGLAKLYNNVALIHTQLGEYPKALEGFTLATRFEEETGNQEGLAQGLNNIGVVFYYQEDFDKAMAYFLESVKVHEAMGNRLSAKQGYNNIGAINEALKRFPEALSFYMRSLNIALEMDDEAELGHSYNNIAGVYSNLKEWTKAEEYYQKAIAYNSSNDDYYSLSLNYLNLGEMYTLANQMGKAEAWIVKAQSLVERYSYKDLALEVFERGGAFYAKAGRFEEAYQYQLLYDTYKDSVYNESKAKSLAETEALYETEKKEREAAEAKAALAQKQLIVERQMVWLSILIGGVLLLVVIAVSVFRQQSARRRQIEAEAELQEEKTRAEGRKRLDEERNRISRDLHDHIGAQLTIISSQIDNLAFKESSEERRLKFEQISDHTRDTMAQLRETIWAMRNDQINLEMLGAKLQDFIQRSHQDGRHFHFQNFAESAIVLSPEQTINLFRICQEAIQNAIKYADFKNLSISFKEQHGQLEVLIEDDGKGMEAINSNRGDGLRNMEARMKQIQGSFEIKSKPDLGTSILLKVAINTPIAL